MTRKELIDRVMVGEKWIVAQFVSQTVTRDISRSKGQPYTICKTALLSEGMPVVREEFIEGAPAPESIKCQFRLGDWVAVQIRTPRVFRGNAEWIGEIHPLSGDAESSRKAA